MPPRQTPTTFPDRLGNGCFTPPPPVNAIQTDIHDDLRLLGRRKLLFCSSIAGQPDRHPRHSRTALATNATQTDTHNVSAPPGRRMLHSSTSGKCNPDTHPRRSQTDWGTEAPLLQFYCMPPRQTSTTFSDCLVDGSSSSAAPLHATQTDTHDVLGLPEQRMPPRQTPTTFPDRLGNGCCTPPHPVNAIQTDIHDVLRLLGRRKLLSCNSIACHPDRHPRRSRTA